MVDVFDAKRLAAAVNSIKKPMVGDYSTPELGVRDPQRKITFGDDEEMLQDNESQRIFSDLESHQS